MHVAYRIVDTCGATVTAEGHRTDFVAPVPPGDATTVNAVVELPATAGEYEIVVTLVQEAFTWFDDIDQACRATIRAHVADAQP